MSDAVKAEIVGLPQFAAQLKRLGAAASSDALERAGQAALLPVQNAAAQKAPVLTRTLARSIHIETLEKGEYKVELAVGTDVIYAAIQEFGGVVKPKTAKALHWVDRESGEDRFAGSVTIPAHPYLRPAWDENKNAMIEKIKSTLTALIKAAAAA